jgi:hypothetical protein
MADFPNELLLEIFSYLPLKGLIAARGVSRTWRNLVHLSNIPPVRRALLDLYNDVIQTPEFLSSRKMVISALLRFDRKAYVAALEEQIKGPLPAVGNQVRDGGAEDLGSAIAVLSSSYIQDIM